MRRDLIQVEKISQEIAEDLCRKIIKDLPEYFGLPDVNEAYAAGMHSRQNFAAKIDGDYIGLISLDFHYSNNCNIYWMAVLRDFQGQGVGCALIESASNFAKEKAARTMTVETLAPSDSDKNYLRTYTFYQSVGFLPLLNLKPQSHEWSMVYMLKTLEVGSKFCNAAKITIRTLSISDIPVLMNAFQNENWPKNISTFENYLKEQNIGSRFVWIAYVDNCFAGYVTITWESKYKDFAKSNIPEIMDLSVLPSFRKIGVGSMLLDVAEKKAATKSQVVGLGVGLYSGPDGGYGMAQKLYVKRGYVPDGKGMTSHYKETIPGNTYLLDDDLVLWFTKKLDGF
jgi:GNAT superfamily N-acetyltransferase